MNAQVNSKVLNLLEKTGQFVSITTMRDVKVKKGMPSIQKKSKFVARIGVNYDNIKTVQEKRANGDLPEENAGLNGFKWVKFPVLLKSEKSEKFYVRCTKGANTKTETHFYIDGKEVSREEVKAMAYASEFSSSGDSEVFNISVDSIVSITG